MYYFIGIKGSGMASLACILHDKGEEVQGSDIEKYIFTQDALEERNIKILNFNENNIHDNMNVIIGNAFDKSNPEVAKALANKTIRSYYYHEFLGEFLSNFTSVSIAGTHGKTTTTGMCSSLLDINKPTSYLIGDGTGYLQNNSHYFVLESCEYQDHFLSYKPDYAIITNIDLDHVDYFKTLENCIKSFNKFANQVKKCVILFGDDENIRSMEINTSCIYYGLGKNNDVYADNIEYSSDGTKFDCYYKNKLYASFKTKLIGKHLLWNTLSIITLGILENMSIEQIQLGLDNFQGVKRRFNIEEIDDYVYIDDYAHHPTAIELTIESARIKYPNKKIIAIYKPDRYSRLLALIDEFASSLAKADEVYLCDFASNTKKEDGVDVSIEDLAKLINNCEVISEDENGAKILFESGPACYLFMSSKDIYKLKNIVKSFH